MNSPAGGGPPRMSNHTIDVLGATISYEAFGEGPVLALVGHPMGAEGFRALAERLANDHTVVLHDPRGIGSSPIDDPTQPADPELLAEDLAAVLRQVTDSPADIFGSSGGGITSLALTGSHPELVRSVVAHEPPLISFLADAENVTTGIRGVREVYRDHGLGAAMGAFIQLAGIAIPEPGPDTPSMPAPSAADIRASERLITAGLEPVCLYRPDLAALRGADIVIGVGTTSAGELAHRCGVALAEALATEPLVFPSHHAGFAGPEMGGDPDAFAARLREVLHADRGTRPATA